VLDVQMGAKLSKSLLPACGPVAQDQRAVSVNSFVVVRNWCGCELGRCAQVPQKSDAQSGRCLVVIDADKGPKRWPYSNREQTDTARGLICHFEQYFTFNVDCIRAHKP